MTTRAGAGPSISCDRPPRDGTSPEVGRVDETTRYQYLIAVVEGLETAVTIDLLVDAMVEWEVVHSDGDEKSWHDVHEELYLVDLPTLNRVGLLEFDEDTGTVAHSQQ